MATILPPVEHTHVDFTVACGRCHRAPLVIDTYTNGAATTYCRSGRTMGGCSYEHRFTAHTLRCTACGKRYRVGRDELAAARAGLDLAFVSPDQSCGGCTSTLAEHPRDLSCPGAAAGTSRFFLPDAALMDHFDYCLSCTLGSESVEAVGETVVAL